MTTPADSRPVVDPKLRATLLDRVAEAILLTDHKGRFVYVNGTAAEHLGCEPDQAIGMSVSDLDLTLQPEVWPQHWRRLKDEGGLVLESRHRRHDGSVVPVELSIAYIEDRGREFSLATVRDISERKRWETRVEYRLAFETLVTDISTRFAEVTPDDLDAEIVRALGDVGSHCGVDRAYLFLYSDDRTRSSNTHEWCAEDIESQQSRLQDVPVDGFPWIMAHMRRGEPARADDLSVIPPGEERDTLTEQGIRSLLIIPVKHGDELIGSLGFDAVTEQRPWTDEDVGLLENFAQMLVNTLMRCRAEERLRATLTELEDRVAERTAELASAKEEADAANRAKGRFLATMSHELRTPLNAVIGFAELLDAQPDLADSHRRYVSDIRAGGERLLEMVNDILELAELEADEKTMRLADVDLTEICQIAAVAARSRAEAKEIDIELDLADDLPVIEGDFAMLRTILLHLLSNAIRFTPRGRSIRVSSRVREGSAAASQIADEPGRWVEAAVRDSGIGIAPEDAERIFREFEQVDSSMTRAHPGSGLGLALARRYATMHGGWLWVESAGRGHGSTFRLALPV